MIEQVLYDIPIEYRDRYQELLQEAAVHRDELISELEHYIATVRQVAQMVRLLDLSQAEELAETCLQLLKEVDTTDTDTHRLLQAAVRYFILEEDDEEITGVLGFDDDILVVNAVSRAVGRSDLVIPLKKRH